MNIDFAAKGFVLNPDGSYSKPKRGADPAAQAQSPRPAKRIRQDTKPLMNKLEAEWLNFGLSAPRDEAWFVMSQAMRFKLANGLWYKPDFVVRKPATISAYEVKGPHAFRGGFENLKMAATTYTWIKWFLVWKENGTWQEQEVLP